MALPLKRSHSRRHIAAVTFLSNISLDGSCKDTRSALLNRNGTFYKTPFPCNKYILEKFNGNEECSNDTEKKKM